MTETIAVRSSLLPRRAWFWLGCLSISVGVALHLPMLAMAHSMGNHLSGMPMDGWMMAGMAAIVLGVPIAIYGALPGTRAKHDAQRRPKPGRTFSASH